MFWGGEDPPQHRASGHTILGWYLPKSELSPAQCLRLPSMVRDRASGGNKEQMVDLSSSRRQSGSDTDKMVVSRFHRIVPLQLSRPALPPCACLGINI